VAEINGISVPFIPIERYDDLSKLQKINPKDSFQAIFQQEVDGLKFSNHAMKRLESRNISLSSSELDKIQTAVGKAQQKGSKDSLVMMDNTAYIVNIPNKTVVTAVPVGDDNENVFTNIDSVVFA
jgi:flagellar operon protein